MELPSQAAAVFAEPSPSAPTRPSVLLAYDVNDEPPRIDAVRTEVDVLSGRRGFSNNNPGNKRYLNMGRTLKAEYQRQGTDNARKKEIGEELIDFIHKGINGVRGRFLKRHRYMSDSWQELSARERWTKVSQVLREE